MRRFLFRGRLDDKSSTGRHDLELGRFLVSGEDDCFCQHEVDETERRCGRLFGVVEDLALAVEFKPSLFEVAVLLRSEFVEPPLEFRFLFYFLYLFI